jgi:biopolymer transport protein ExbB
MSATVERFLAIPVVEQAIEIWVAGGWGMIALTINALILFAIGINLWLNLASRRFGTVRESTWRAWIENPAGRRGRVGELIEFLMGARDPSEMAHRFGELHAIEIASFARDLKFMKRAVSTAPLLGLLGTVTGMLATFQGLASGAGGQKTMDLVAGGISQALITTETGLVIALPGLFFQFHLTRQRDRYEAFLAKLQTACTQFLYSRSTT